MQIGDRYIEVRDVIEKMGVEIEMESNGWLVAKCPLHTDEHRSFAVNEENGGWSCYAGCGKGSFIELIARYGGVTNQEARKRLLEEGTVVSEDTLVQELLRGPRAERLPVELEDLFFEQGKTYRYMANRGFTTETLKAFDVGRDLTERAVVIPAYEGERLVGLIKRRIDPGWRMKYDYTRRWAKSQHVFGLDRCEGDEVVLVEGAVDAMWLHQYGFPGAALLGSRMSEVQRDKVLRRMRRVTLAFDPDDAGFKCTDDALQQFASRGVEVRVVVWPFHWVENLKTKEMEWKPVYGDVQECSEEVLGELLQAAKPAYGAAA